MRRTWWRFLLSKLSTRSHLRIIDHRSPFAFPVPRLLHSFTMSGERASGLLLSLIILAPLWLFASRYLKKPTLKRSVIVFVLGDVGRSPRMMYHAESFVNNGFETYIVGYRGTRHKVPFGLQTIDKVTCRFKANTRSIVNTPCPIFLPPSAPSLLFASSFCVPRPHKDNSPSFNYLHHPPVHNSQHI